VAQVSRPDGVARRDPLGQILLRKGLVTGDQLAAALETQRRSGDRLGRILVSLGYVNQLAVARALAEQFGLPFRDLLADPPPAELVRLLDEDTARRFRAVPVAVDGDVVEVAVADPWDEAALVAVAARLGRPVRWVVTGELDIYRTLERVYRDVYLDRARSDLLLRRPDQSAHETFTGGQLGAALVTLALLFIGLLVAPRPVTVGLSAAVAAVYAALAAHRLYLMVRALTSTSEVEVTAEELRAIDEQTLPEYTILVPLYRETEVLPALLGALAAPNAGLIPFGTTYPVPNFGLFIQPTTGGAVQGQSLEDDGFTWRLTARYDLTDDASVYANYARGRRPAVLAVGVPAIPPGAGAGGGEVAFNVVDEETVDSFEVGVKGANLLDGTLRFEAAAFYYGYENFQTTIQDGAQLITTNAGEATSYGVETQAIWTPVDTVDLFATYAYNNSRFDTGIFEGNRFRLSPDHQASVGASARFAVAGGELRVTPTYTWQSKVFFDDNNDIPALQAGLVADMIQDEFQDSYGLLNLRMAFAPGQGNWELEAFADNILDEDYIKDAGNTGDALGLATFIAGAPTTYGVGLTLRY